MRLELENMSAAPLAAKRIDIDAVDDAGHELVRLDATKARKAIESYYGLTIRSSSGDKRYKEDFAANAIDLRTPLAPGERRQGLLFLRLPRDATSRRRVHLVVASKHDGARVETALE